MVFLVALLTPVGAARASSTVLCSGYTSCADKGYSNAGYSTHKSTSYWRMYTGTNCTNYVAYRLVSNGMPNVRPKSGVGNAQDWGFAMASITDSTPAVGSVAWWGRTGHHVAYVEKIVSPTEIWVSESNWSGAFDWRKITKSGSGWPDGFIHFSDRVLENTTRPTIRSTPQVGVALAPSVGKWTVMGNSYAYQWTADGTSISGATTKSYTPTPSVAGKALSLQVTASRPGYSPGTATSASEEVEPGELTPGVPTVDGTGRVDEPLIARPGTWTPTPSTYSYQWSVAGSPVSGAASPTFTPRPEDNGRAVTVAMTSALAGYRSTAATSPAPVTVLPGNVTSTANPTIIGTPAVGATLTARPGSWSVSSLAYDYQWLVDGTAIAGATGATYKPTPADRTRPVSVRVTARRSGYLTTSATSAPTAKTAYGTLPASAPKITGSTRLGSTPAVDVGTRKVPQSTVRVQWLRNGVAISGATALKHKVTQSDLGKKLSAKVTWTADGYTRRTLTSSAVGPAKATAKIKATATATPSSRTVRFVVRLPVTGLADPSASIAVTRRGGGTVKFSISRGKGTVTLTKQPAGASTYTFTYAGTSKITSAKTTVKTTIKK
ncbi:hypothetical protein C6I20_01605 [Aeromicrobium sp. A1-2]|nr:hypothetical protein C6I20_01605 [Aeromicrobium sp. A1-2]